MALTQRRFISLLNTARELGVGKGPVGKLVDAGELTAVNVAGPDAPRPILMVERASIEAFIERRRVQPTEPAPLPRRRPRRDPAVKSFFE
jgi:hypothetical protein